MTISEIAAMTAQEAAQNWNEVQAFLSGLVRQEKLTLEQVEKMTPAEINANWNKIKPVLEGER